VSQIKFCVARTAWARNAADASSATIKARIPMFLSLI
jgi:hypothetical protein